MIPLTISSEVVTVTTGARAEAGRVDRSSVSGASRRLDTASLGSIQVRTSQQLTSHLLDPGYINN